MEKSCYDSEKTGSLVHFFFPSLFNSPISIVPILLLKDNEKRELKHSLLPNYLYKVREHLKSSLMHAIPAERPLL